MKRFNMYKVYAYYRIYGILCANPRIPCQTATMSKEIKKFRIYGILCANARIPYAKLQHCARKQNIASEKRGFLDHECKL
jgi:hypothetical protein